MIFTILTRQSVTAACSLVQMVHQNYSDIFLNHQRRACNQSNTELRTAWWRISKRSSRHKTTGLCGRAASSECSVFRYRNPIYKDSSGLSSS